MPSSRSLPTALDCFQFSRMYTGFLRKAANVECSSMGGDPQIGVPSFNTLYAILIVNLVINRSS